MAARTRIAKSAGVVSRRERSSRGGRWCPHRCPTAPRPRRAGADQEGLAERAGVSVDLIKKLEQGSRSAARLSTLITLANALDVSLSQLIDKQPTLAETQPASPPGHGPAPLVETGWGVLTTDLWDSVRGCARREGLPDDALLDLLHHDPRIHGLFVALERGEVSQAAFEAELGAAAGISPERLLARMCADLQPDEAMLTATAALRA
jgi:transcriptional regulator with XRE-family HTH domain